MLPLGEAPSLFNV